MMNNWDWERFGEDIQRTVQDAIESKDFCRLNETITNTVNSAVNNFTNTVRNAKSAQQSQDDWRNLNLNQLKHPTLYAKTTGAKVGGMILAITGYGVGAVMLLTFLSVAAAGVFLGMNAGIGITLVFLAVLILGFAILAGIGTKKLGSIRRFQNYVQEMQGREYCDIKELAQCCRKKEKFVIKDLEKMIEKRWFIQGHLDEQGTCLMTSNEAYKQYRQLMAQMAEQNRMREEDASRAKQETQKKEAEKEKRRKELNPEIQAVIEAGNGYIRKIRECNDAIPGEVVSAKISRMELLTRRIFERVEQNPEVVSDIRRMMEYYLPTAVKLLEAYEELDGQPIQGENILSSKKEIEDTLDTLNTAFEKLLDDMFQDTAWDVASDISVLRTMLAQEGLTGNDFTRGGK